MHEKKKLWIVSELFFPEETSTAYYLTEIAKKIALHQPVNVICGDSTYERKVNCKSILAELPTNINVVRVKSSSLNKNNLILRILRLIGTSVGLGLKLITKIHKGDEVWIVTNPAFLIPFAVGLSKIKKFQITILVHDVFPDNLIPANVITPKSIIYKTLKVIFDKAYSSANQVVVCGRDMAVMIERKIGRNNNIKVIENWADTDTIVPLNKLNGQIYGDLGMSEKLVFQFAGNIGRLQGLEELLEVAAKCANRKVHFVFIGDGALKNDLKEIARNKNLTNVTFLNSFDRSQQNIFLNACDVGIVSLYDNMIGLGVPSKTYNIMAAGKPILFLGSKMSEIGMVVAEYGIGWQFELAERNKIITFLNDFDEKMIGNKGEIARKIAESNYSKKIILDKYFNLLG